MIFQLLFSRLRSHGLRLAVCATGSLSRYRNRRFFFLPLAAGVLTLLLATGRLDAQSKLWGMTAEGGKAFGSIFSLSPDGSNFAAYAPEGYPGNNPQYTRLLKASNGKFYGMTNKGIGLEYENMGAMFEYDPTSGAYKILHVFTEQTGGSPYGSLIESGGKFYGMTVSGGLNSAGVIFEYDPAGAGAYTVLHDFDNSDGANPFGSLIESGGKFYGMTESGGSNGDGVLFEYDPAGGGAYNVLYHFAYSTGAWPKSDLLALAGKFYGTTSVGGTGDYGVLFEFDPAGGGTYNVLYEFDNSDGGTPHGSLIESSGKFYGTAINGGVSDEGVLFEYDPAGGGTYTVLHHFEALTGKNPYGSLLLSGGKFYGAAYSGGSDGSGVLYEYDPAGAGTYSVRHHFTEPTGAEPLCTLMESGGKFYGMTSRGGLTSYGVLFEYDPAGSGTYTVRVNLALSPGGFGFYGTLIKSGGKFYGTAEEGGNFDDGVIFQYDPAGAGTYTVLHHFKEATGKEPFGGVTELGGKFYGTTYAGGNFDNGTLFVYDPAGSGTYTVLHHFDGTDGEDPRGHLLAMGGKLYGTAEFGGNGDGVLFEYNPAGSGTYTVLHYFDYSTDGQAPVGSLIEVGGKLYGTAVSGGSNFNGTIYRYDPAGAGTFSVLYNFDGTSGGNPYGALLESGGKFYGTLAAGGNNSEGVLYEFDPAGAGTFTPLHHFESATGRFPNGGVVKVNGKFYGTAADGGDFNGGVVFEFDPAGPTYTVIRHLKYEDGVSPQCDLFVDAPAAPVGTSVSGKIIWENDGADGVGGTLVTLTGSQTGTLTTTGDGLYSFNLTAGANVTVTPTKTVNKLNGITVADATRIQQHLTGNPFTNYYKTVAADVNKSNSVSAIDASVINQALLGSASALQQFKTSWRFVPTAHVMSNPPWSFPEKIVLTNANGAITGQDFYAIKTGDVVAGFADPDALIAAEALVLNVPDQVLQAGQPLTLNFSANQFADLAALQMALHFDPQVLNLVAIAPAGGLPLSDQNFGLSEVTDGRIRVVWSQAAGLFVTEAAPVFQMTFDVLQGGVLLSDVLRTDEETLPGRAYTTPLHESGVTLNFSGLTGTADPAGLGVQLLQNRPNPFTGSTTVGFILTEAGDAQLRVFEAAGKLLAERKGYYPAGKHEEVFNLEGASGVLWYELTTTQGVLAKKMTAGR